MGVEYGVQVQGIWGTGLLLVSVINLTGGLPAFLSCFVRIGVGLGARGVLSLVNEGTGTSNIDILTCFFE